MSGKLTAHPVWAGVAIRMADGTLYAVEIDRRIYAELKVEQDIADITTAFDAHRVYAPTDLHVDVHVRGIGRRVSRFGPDMGAEQQPGQLDPATKAIEAAGG